MFPVALDKLEIQKCSKLNFCRQVRKLEDFIQIVFRFLCHVFYLRGDEITEGSHCDVRDVGCVICRKWQKLRFVEHRRIHANVFMFDCVSRHT